MEVREKSVVREDRFMPLLADFLDTPQGEVWLEDIVFVNHTIAASSEVSDSRFEIALASRNGSGSF